MTVTAHRKAERRTELCQGEKSGMAQRDYSVLFSFKKDTGNKYNEMLIAVSSGWC